jgi:AhpD family alkylhydroperoxidase
LSRGGHQREHHVRGLQQFAVPVKPAPALGLDALPICRKSRLESRSSARSKAMVEAPRFELKDMPRDFYGHLLQMEGLIVQHLDLGLYHLIKLRASQINGCAYCLAMHTDEALRHGETPERIVSLDAWEESPLYTDRERAALAWTEAVTLISETHAPDDVYNEVRAHFSEAETVNLTMLIGAINAWNRLAISFRAVPPVKVAATAA